MADKRPDPTRPDPTRTGAFALLSGVLDRHRTLEDGLEALPPMDARDRAAAHRLAAAALRRLGSLDAALEPYLTKAPPIPVRHVLRLGAAGLLLLGTPAHAAVATAVALARSQRLAPFAGLVNAVLRRLAEAGPAALEGLDGPRLDTPPWLWSAWGADARAIAEAHQHEAPLDLTLRPGAAAPPGGEELPTGSWRYPPGTRPAELAGYAEGAFWVQDAAAALPARLLAPLAGMRVADLCAAPGGKTAQLAAAGAVVTAVERDPARLARLEDNLRRLRLTAETVAADVLEWQPGALFDAVLLDAPCSATGTIRRHPDVPHLKRARDIATLATQQDRMLDAACALLRPGGRLVYAVCSLQPEEGPARALTAAARLPLRPEPLRAHDLPGLAEAITPEGWLRTTPALWPAHGGMDGFFAARFTRA
jgi:16S rRNA (cytosine967-C5)-methyltransferase